MRQDGSTGEVIQLVENEDYYQDALDWRGAWRIVRRDGGKHRSPNAGGPEAAMAGALGIRVGGTNFYGGERHDGQYLGDRHNPLDDQALRDALRLTGCVSLLMFALCLSVRLLVNW